MKVEVEQKRLELEKQFSLPITRHTPTIKLSKLELQKFKKQDSSGKNFGTLLKPPFTRIQTLSLWST